MTNASTLCTISAGLIIIILHNVPCPQEKIQDTYMMNCIGRKALSNQDFPPKQLRRGGEVPQRKNSKGLWP